LSNSSEFRCYAYFKITSDLPLEAIQKHMKSEGDGRTWSKGDPRKRVVKGKTVFPGGKYSFSMWQLVSGVELGQPLDLHIQALWRRLAGCRDQICDLPDTMCGVVQGTGFFKTHRDPFVLSSGHYQTASFYGLPIDFDFYYEDNFGYEDEGTPYWEW